MTLYLSLQSHFENITLVGSEFPDTQMHLMNVMYAQLDSTLTWGRIINVDNINLNFDTMPHAAFCWRIGELSKQNM